MFRATYFRARYWLARYFGTATASVAPPAGPPSRLGEQGGLRLDATGGVRLGERGGVRLGTASLGGSRRW
jgi:hypothetical protein